MEGFEEDDLEAEDLDEMTSGDVTRTVKCLVVGNGHVGKSTYVRRFCRGKYEDEYKKTIGCVFGERRGFKVRTYPFHKHPKEAPRSAVDMIVWDTAGQEEYRELNHKYYAGAGCVLLCFSTRDKSSLKDLPGWRAKVLELCGKDVPMCVVQTKVDASEDSADSVTPTEAKNAAREMGLKLFRISSKEGRGIDEPFEYVASMCLKRGGGNDEQQLEHISRHKAEAVESREIDVHMRNAGSSDDDDDDDNDDDDEGESNEKDRDDEDNGKQDSAESGGAPASAAEAPHLESEEAAAARKADEAEELKRQEAEFQRKRLELQKGSSGGCCTVS